MSDIFEKYTIKSKSLIRIIRNADIDIDEDFYDNGGSYRESMETLLKVRKNCVRSKWIITDQWTKRL